MNGTSNLISVLRKGLFAGALTTAAVAGLAFAPVAQAEAAAKPKAAVSTNVSAPAKKDEKSEKGKHHKAAGKHKHGHKGNKTAASTTQKKTK